MPVSKSKPKNSFTLGENANFPVLIIENKSHTIEKPLFFISYLTWSGEKVENKNIFQSRIELEMFLLDFTTPYYQEKILETIFQGKKFKQFKVKLGSY